MVRRLISRIELWVLAFAVAVILPELWARLAEAHYFPVITRLEITAIQSDPAGTVVAGRARRLRNCNWVETRWWLGRRGQQRVPVDVRFRDRPQIRSAGATSWTGIVIVDLSPSQVLNNSHSDVIYRCYPGPWSAVETVNQFYDGLGQDADLITSERQRQILDAVEGLRNQVDDLAR